MLGRSEKSLKLAESWGLLSALVSTAADDAFDCVVESSGNIEGEKHVAKSPSGLYTGHRVIFVACLQ